MKLETTKENVLKAAESCSDAKNVLTKLFPDVFKEEYEEGSYYKPSSNCIVVCTKGGYDENKFIIVKESAISRSAGTEITDCRKGWAKKIDNPFK